MSKTSWLLSSTALVGIAGGTTAVAGDFGNAPAVSDFNARFEARAATENEIDSYAAIGSFTAPVGHSFGFQVDGLLGTLDGEFAGAAATHVFWRDPDAGLLGIYGEIGDVAADGGGTVGRVAVEAEAYVGRLTFTALLGGQFGDVGEGFFSKESVSFYPTDDLRLYATHRYLPDDVGHSGALGAEWLTPLAGNSLSLYGEGRLGENDNWGACGGIRVYFGPQKPLIDRHRQDDAPDHFDLFMQAASSGVAAIGDPVVE
jgi:hypothetical protein